MSSGTINATKYLSRQGIDPHMMYKAEVVRNDDPRFLGRIKARIEGVFDGIPDGDLPWAVPLYQHCDGSKAGGWSSNHEDSGSGTFHVPKKKHIVSLKFPQGDPHKPIWLPYTLDEKGILEETKVNYPDRAVFRFSNGCYMIIDTKTNEVFLNNPGDVDITILGDVNEYIVGNKQQVIHDSKGSIPGYLTGMPGSIIGQLSPKPTKQIPFQGLLGGGGGKGNSHTHVKGNLTTLVEGHRMTVIKGNDITHVNMNRYETITILHRIQALRSETNG